MSCYSIYLFIHPSTFFVRAWGVVEGEGQRKFQHWGKKTPSVSLGYFKEQLFVQTWPLFPLPDHLTSCLCCHCLCTHTHTLIFNLPVSSPPAWNSENLLSSNSKNQCFDLIGWDLNGSLPPATAHNKMHPLNGFTFSLSTVCVSM